MRTRLVYWFILKRFCQQLKSQVELMFDGFSPNSQRMKVGDFDHHFFLFVYVQFLSIWC